MQNTYRYDPYGNQETATGTVPNPWRYHGTYRDPTGLYKMGIRYYDPTTAMFTQVEPLKDSSALRGLIDYTYAGGDPINQMDPSGMFIDQRCIRRNTARFGRNPSVLRVLCGRSGGSRVARVINSVLEQEQNERQFGKGTCAALAAVGVVALLGDPEPVTKSMAGAATIASVVCVFTSG